jgi:hypothetical protein
MISEETNPDKTVTVFPNPSRENTLTINIYTEQESEASISILTSSSQAVVDTQQKLSPGVNSIQVKTDHIKEGLHLLIIRYDNKRIAKKVVIGK